jgi:predicted component of type VI protein secretion system
MRKRWLHRSFHGRRERPVAPPPQAARSIQARAQILRTLRPAIERHYHLDRPSHPVPPAARVAS